MKPLRPLLSLFFTAALAVATANAMTYNWEQHHLAFEAPEGAFVPISTPDYVELHWDEMLITLRTYDKAHYDKKLMKDNLRRIASGYNMYDTKEGNMKIKGFKGRYLDGTMPDGSRALITQVMSKKSDLVLEITVNYLYGNREEVDDILKSFAENNNGKPNTSQHKQKVQKKEDAEREKKDKERKERRRDEKVFDV